MNDLPLVPSIANYSFTTQIESDGYRFNVRWNTRAKCWFMDVFEAAAVDVDDTPIVRGVAIVLGTFLGRRSTHKLFTQGVFMALDMTGQGRDATLDDLGTRVIVRRYTRAEVLEAYGYEIREVA